MSPFNTARLPRVVLFDMRLVDFVNLYQSCSPFFQPENSTPQLFQYNVQDLAGGFKYVLLSPRILGFHDPI